MSMILHCGAETVTREMVEAIVVPEHTDSWKPVPYKDAIDFLHDTIESRLGLKIKMEEYGLNKEGNQLFALATMEVDPGSVHGLSIGLRQSYNKSLALGVAVGAQVFVCDNLCFSGNAFKVVRKNTRFVWDDFQRLVVEQVEMSLDHYADVQTDITGMQTKNCNNRRGMSFLGVLFGEGLLTAHQLTAAMREWKEPANDVFEGRNLWSLYNAVTEGLKVGPPGTRIDRQTTAHKFFTDVVRKAA